MAWIRERIPAVFNRFKGAPQSLSFIGHWIEPGGRGHGQWGLRPVKFVRYVGWVLDELIAEGVIAYELDPTTKIKSYRYLSLLEQIAWAARDTEQDDQTPPE
jgi:hypothetical protein